MAQHKKPSPGNKHETRLVTESRSAGVAPSTYREEAGSSVDMVSIVGEKPNVVRISQAAYNGLVRDGTDFYRREHFILPFHVPPVAPATIGVWQEIGQIVVPAGIVLDLSDVSFTCTTFLSAGAGALPQQAVPNDWVREIYIFRVSVNYIVPYDGRVQWLIMGIDHPGLSTLNENWLSTFGDCPVHLIAGEGQVMRFEAAQVTNDNPTLIGMSRMIARPRGRWIPIQHYKRIIGANALE